MPLGDLGKKWTKYFIIRYYYYYYYYYYCCWWVDMSALVPFVLIVKRNDLEIITWFVIKCDLTNDQLPPYLVRFIVILYFYYWTYMYYICTRILELYYNCAIANNHQSEAKMTIKTYWEFLLCNEEEASAVSSAILLVVKTWRSHLIYFYYLSN